MVLAVNNHGRGRLITENNGIMTALKRGGSVLKTEKKQKPGQLTVRGNAASNAGKTRGRYMLILPPQYHRQLFPTFRQKGGCGLPAMLVKQVACFSTKCLKVPTAGRDRR